MIGAQFTQQRTVREKSGIGFQPVDLKAYAKFISGQ